MCPAPGASAVIRFLFADAVRAIPARRIFLPACIPLRPCASAYQAHCALRVLARFAGEKTKGETAAQCRPAERERRDGVFCRETTGRRIYVKRFKLKSSNGTRLALREGLLSRHGKASRPCRAFFPSAGQGQSRQGRRRAWRGVLFTGSGGLFCLRGRRCRGRVFCLGELAQASSPCSLRDKGHGVWSGRPARGMRW